MVWPLPKLDPLHCASLAPFSARLVMTEELRIAKPMEGDGNAKSMEGDGNATRGLFVGSTLLLPEEQRAIQNLQERPWAAHPSSWGREPSIPSSEYQEYHLRSPLLKKSPIRIQFHRRSNVSRSILPNSAICNGFQEQSCL